MDSKQLVDSLTLRLLTRTRVLGLLGQEDIDMEAEKTEPWKGELVIVLKANDTLVQCHTIQTTSPSDYPSRAEIEFDVDSRKDYEKQAVCESRLDS